MCMPPMRDAGTREQLCAAGHTSCRRQANSWRQKLRSCSTFACSACMAATVPLMRIWFRARPQHRASTNLAAVLASVSLADKSSCCLGTGNTAAITPMASMYCALQRAGSFAFTTSDIV